MIWILWVVLGLIASYLLSVVVIGFIVYSILLLRTSKQKWARKPSIPGDEEYMRLYEDGMRWREENLSFKKDVAINSCGYALKGEYFDFGFRRAVIVIPGRMESCYYCCHYAAPFKAAGWNVLTIDDRAHGLSEGIVNSLGYKEYRDIIAWAKMLHDDLGNTQVLLHGVCIGSSAALFAMTSGDCPPYMVGMIADGMYQRFLDSFNKHMVEDKHPKPPLVYPMIMQYVRLISGADVTNDGPFYRIDRLKKPVLFLHSREDSYSIPEKAQQLFDKCTAPKKVVWFEKGAHSRVRIKNPQAYDEAVIAYLAETYGA